MTRDGTSILFKHGDVVGSGQNVCFDNRTKRDRVESWELRKEAGENHDCKVLRDQDQGERKASVR